MSNETGVTVLLTDGSEEHFESAVRWTSRDDGGIILISHEPDGENQQIVAEYLSGRAVRVCQGPPFRVVPEVDHGNVGPSDDALAAAYEAGYKAHEQSVEHPPEAAPKVGGNPSDSSIAREPQAKPLPGDPEHGAPQAAPRAEAAPRDEGLYPQPQEA